MSAQLSQTHLVKTYHAYPWPFSGLISERSSFLPYVRQVEIVGPFKSACPHKTNIDSARQRPSDRSEDDDANDYTDTVVDHRGDDGMK
jgi:hypothetical protein